ncbi:MAG TPA: class I SAM-dependent methyltransferase [Terriglobales bacterium]|nr:class I SAM-dependent methyltransferase [Terriglobales bacterium]
MSAAHDQYALGRSPQEYARLARQAEFLRPMTQRLFEDAGIGAGATVLDLGSGAGDVAMLLAEMVGPEGKVIGLDLDHDAMQHARERAIEARFHNVSFVHSDIAHYHPDAPLDAIVGRLVLMYQADPAAALKQLTKYLRPGGVVAFIEPWFQTPPGPDGLTKTTITCLNETLRRSGAHIDLGRRLHRVFQAAGLPVPNMRLEAVVDGRDDSPLYQYVADTLASLLPKALEYGVPNAGKLDVPSLPGIIRAEMNAAGYAMMMATVVCAWCRTPE